MALTIFVPKFKYLMQRVSLKFMFSKKAVKFEEIFTVDLTSRGKCQIDVEDLVSFCGLLRKHELHHKILQNFSQKGDTINIHVLFSRKKKIFNKKFIPCHL